MYGDSWNQTMGASSWNQLAANSIGTFVAVTGGNNIFISTSGIIYYNTIVLIH